MAHRQNSPTRKTWVERAWKWVIRITLLALVVSSPWPFGSVTPRPAAFLTVALFVLCGLHLTLSRYFDRLRLPPGWIWLVAAVVLVGYQLIPLPTGWVGVTAPSVGRLYAALDPFLETNGWHPSSAEPFQTRWLFLQLASLIAAFYVSSQLFRHGPERRALAYAVAALGVALALFAVYQKARFGNVLYGKFQVPSGTPYGPFVNHNHFAGLVEACGLLTLGIALGTSRRNPAFAVLLGGTSVLMGISIVLSHSRGGLIATAAGIALVTVLHRSTENRARVAIGAGAAAVAMFLFAFAPNSLADRLWTVTDPTGDTSIQFRLRLWSDSMGVVAASPVVGTGLGTYRAVIPAYRTGVDETRAEFAESDWLQLICETGILGLAIALGFLATILRVGWRALASTTSERNRGFLAGSLAAVAALLVHGVYDFNLHIPSNALVFAILLGCIASFAEDSDEPSGSRRWFPVSAAAVAAAVVFLSGTALAIGDSRRLTRQIDPVRAGPDDFADSIERLSSSRRAAPQNAETLHLLGRLYNEEAYRSHDAARYRVARLEQARGAFREALELAPARGRYWFELGWTEANLGNDVLADASFERAVELEPQNSSIRANISAYLASRGRIDEALEQLAHGRELEPGIPALEALNILAPFVGDDPVVLRRAAGSGEDADEALARYRQSMDGDLTAETPR